MAGCKSKSCASNMYIVSIAGMVILLIGSDYMYMSAIGGVKPIVLNSSIHFQILGNSVLPLTEMPNVSSSTEKSKSTKPQKWALVDTRKHYNNSIRVSQFRPIGLHRILWFNPPPWIKSHDFMSLCDHNNCQVTVNRALIRNVSAVMFCVIHPGMGYTPPLGPGERDSDQVWVFYGLESPFNHHFSDYASPHWRNTFNWSMTYRTDSDVQQPYGTLETLETPIEKDYNKLFLHKTKFAVWIVSHCATHSKREDFVREMQKYVFVDIYGKCGRRFQTDVTSLVKEYKFFLSFENSLCPDYVTEKFFNYFGLDIIQVVRGGVDYDKLLPNDTFVNTAKFPDVKALTQYLIDVGSDQERYVGYIRRKAAYKSYKGGFTYENSMCDLCRQLNQKNSYRNSYKDIHEYIQKTKVCIQPSEVSDIRSSKYQ